MLQVFLDVIISLSKKMQEIGSFVLTGAVGIVILIACTTTSPIYNDDRNHLFEVSATTSEILSEIRLAMRNESLVGEPIHAYIIPYIGAHQSEYIPDSDRRIHFVSSFSGTAGTVVVTDELALLWTDSRYHIQAEDQLDLNDWNLMRSGNPGVPTYEEWLAETLPPNSIVGIDPLLIDSSSYESLALRLSAAGHTLRSVPKNLVDEVWVDKPSLALMTIVPLPYQYSGKRISEKLADVRRELRTLGAQYHMVIALDDIAWLLNLRGNDIRNQPVFFAYVIIAENEIQLYVLDTSRITEEIEEHFRVEGVDHEIKVFEYDSALPGLGQVVNSSTGKILLWKASQAIYETVPASRRLTRTSPIILQKIVKNAVEANGMREANIRDGVAVIQYLNWLNDTIDNENVTELSGAAALSRFREAQDNYRGLSTIPISAVGSNAAMAHYRPTEKTNQQITRDKIYLIDWWSVLGRNHRTVHFGQPEDIEKEAFTRVLKGFISMGTAIFPVRAPFTFFDAIARRTLWDVGVNYGHSTGHGIGAYLHIHELPPLLTTTNSDPGPGMMENMFTSNEPGYYEEGAFGIRIEDVVQAVPASPKLGNFNNLGALQFYHVTMVPIQTSLIQMELMTQKEVDWLNEYHERVFNNTADLLIQLDDLDARDWLYEQTRPIVLP